MTQQPSAPDTEIARLRAEVARLRQELKREKRRHRIHVEEIWRSADELDQARVEHIGVLSRLLETERTTVHNAWRTFFFLEKQGDNPKRIRWN